MPKDIAIIAYNTNSGSTQTQDAAAVQTILQTNGYNATLVHQWSLDETNPSQFKSERDWERFDGVVICNFYENWNLRELICSGRPVICANVGYADDLGLGDRLQQHITEDNFNVLNVAHPITNGIVPLGALDIGAPVWTDSVSEHNHHVDVLVKTLANQAVLAVHKTHPLVYWGWYRMSQASPGVLSKLLLSAANWTFDGP